MAYIVDSAVSTGAGSGAQTIDIGSPLTDDLILIFAGIGGSASYGTPTGYTQLYVSTNTVRQYCWYKIATSDSETDPTSTPGFSSNAAFVAVIVRDVDTTTPFGASGIGYNTSTFTNVKEVAAPTLTTGSGKTKNLVLHAGSIMTDSLVPDFAKTTAVARASNSGTMFVAKEWVENASTASTAFTWMTNQSASRTGNLAVIAINNKSGGLRDIGCTMTHTRLLKPYPYGTNDVLSAPDTILVGATPLDGLIAASAASAVSSIGTLSASYLTALNINTNTNFGADTWAGFSWPTPATLDLTGKIVGFAWNPTQPWSSVTTDARGIAIVFSDSTGDWVAYQVRPLASAYLNTDHIEYISPGVSTPYGSSGSITWSDITNITWVYARQSGQTNAPVLNLASLYLFDGVSTLIGGSATKPITGSQIFKHVAQFIDTLGTSGLYPFAAFQGAGQFLGYTPIQIGDGAVPTYLNLVANSLETPPDSARLNDYDVTDAAYGMTLYGSSTCTFDLRSAIIASTGLQTFTMHASSSLSASLLTTGASFIGRTFSDLAGYDWTSTSWTECDTVAFKNGDVTTCTISSPNSAVHATTGAACSFSAAGAIVSGTTINCNKASGVTGYHIELGTAVTAITLTDVTFTGTPGTDKIHVLKTLTNVAAGAFVVGVHYRINTVGTTDFTLIGASANTIGVNFTATGVGSGTGTADQAVKITISGTTSLTEADCTTAGAPVWVAAPQPTLSATVLANTRCLLWNRTTSAELDNTFVAGTSWSKVITGGASTNDVLDLYTFKEGYEESVATIIYAGANASFAVSQATDDAIQYYRTEESITDYTTLTEFNFYAPDIYIQADDADGESTLKKMFIFYNGVLTTADGATYMRGGMTFNSAFDVVINRSVRAIAVDNVSVTQGLYFTDEATIRVTTDDGTSWIAPPSAPGSIRYAFGVAPGQVETGVSGLTGPESAQLLALPNAATTATAVLSAAQTTPIHADLRKAIGQAYHGDGSENDKLRSTLIA